MSIYIPSNKSHGTDMGAMPRIADNILSTANSAAPVQSRAEIRKLLLILGVPIDNMTMGETLDKIEKFVEIGRNTGKTHQVATVNVDFLIKSADDKALLELLQNADMCTADGMPLVWGSKLLGAPLKERVAGSDMVPAIAERAAKNGHSLYLMGAGPGVAAAAGKKLQAQYPGLKIAGVSAPFWKPGEQMDPAVLEDIKASKADILLVALGNPKQEWWIQQYGKEVGIPVAIGIGASLDFIVGTTKRAPEWMQKSGLEWVSRLTQEPGRLWKRYASNIIKFGPMLAQQYWTMGRQSENSEVEFKLDSSTIGDTTIINIQGDVDFKQCKTLTRFGQRSLSIRPKLTINLADVSRLDCAAIGALMELDKKAREAGGELRLVGIKPSTHRVLDRLQLTNFFRISEQDVLSGWQGG